MTGNAIRSQSEVRIFFIPDLRIGDELFLMAIAAFLLLVGPFEFVAREIMVEFVSIEADQLEIPSMMVTVTIDTFLGLYQDGSMVSFLQIDPLFQFSMAFEALFVGYFLSKDVAFCAIGDSFKMGMRLCKVARR